ncbi:hypothetical protein INT47_010200 [Mucor saturninus]|uniref:Uncharacterized protein n=1 Tax=Mucor saturninus TaxID=64648 RepID=A0A8H7RCM7_9FUNG|nr:hypothetical protein INT47_010200 [Mucor saturninus]
MTQDAKLWYLCFKERYPIWGSNVDYVCRSKKLIDWKEFMIHLIKQENATRHFSFEFVKEQPATNTNTTTGSSSRKRKLLADGEQDLGILMDDFMMEKTPFWIQDPLVVDIDRTSKKGIVATGKHRKNIIENRSEHKILFWEYPSWKLKRTFELNLTPPNLTCQIIGIQTIRMPNTSHHVRFFSLAIGMGMGLLQELDDIEDRVDIWKSLFIYRLFQDGSTQCVSHIEISDSFLGREIFLFSDTSWSDDDPNNKLTDWMQIVSPSDATFDRNYTVFILAIGPIYDRITGCVQLAKFDLRGQRNILDPSIIPVYWNRTLNQLLSISNTMIYADPTHIITSIKLGNEVSCMIHFKYPTYLNHLICTGSYQEDELSVYDWRFGIKVGSLPWKSIPSSSSSSSSSPSAPSTAAAAAAAAADAAAERDIMMDVRPWGLESTLVLPSTGDDLDLSHRGFRLIAVGDNRSDNTRDKLEIKVWDISYLLNVHWNPCQPGPLSKEIDFSSRFSWWSRRTSALEFYAYHMLHKEERIVLPYSPPQGFESMLLSHTFDKEEEDDEDEEEGSEEEFIPVKYTAYNVLYTSLFLLTEDGKVTVMDIETGKITGTVENVAAHTLQQVRGIDVNVIAGREVVVTSKEGLLRGIVYQ